jgi:hypothetical protein
MALGEVRLRDWWRHRAARADLRPSAWCDPGRHRPDRIVLWHFAFGKYGEHYPLISLTVASAWSAS